MFGVLYITEYYQFLENASKYFAFAYLVPIPCKLLCSFFSISKRAC